MQMSPKFIPKISFSFFCLIICLLFFYLKAFKFNKNLKFATLSCTPCSFIWRNIFSNNWGSPHCSSGSRAYNRRLTCSCSESTSHRSPTHNQRADTWAAASAAHCAAPRASRPWRTAPGYTGAIFWGGAVPC